MLWRSGCSRSQASRTSPILGSAPGRSGADEPRAPRRLGRGRPRGGLFPRAPCRDLRVFVAHATRGVQFRRLSCRVRKRRFPVGVPLFGRACARNHCGRRGGRRADRLFRPAALAAACGNRRIHHSPAARNPGDRARLRLHPALRLLVHPTLDRDLTRGRRAPHVRLCRPRPAYMYRAVDTALQAIDARTLTEAAQSQGAGPVRILIEIILPNIRSGLLSGAFLTFAIVIGEFTMASLLDRPAFGPYLQRIGASRAYEPSALAIMAFALTWACLGLIQLVGGAPSAAAKR